MESLSTVWPEVGLPGYVLLFLFIVAFLMLLAQLVMARKIMFGGLFAGWATTLLAWAVAGTAVGYRLALDTLGGMQGGNPGLVLKASQVVLLPPFLALGAVTVLLVLQLGAEAVTGPNLARAGAPSRNVRVVVGLALGGLMIGGMFVVRVIMNVNRLYAQREVLSAGAAEALDGQLTSGIVATIVGVVLGLIAIALSLFAGFRQSVSARAVWRQKLIGTRSTGSSKTGSTPPT
jgi:hypothetical protein